MTIDPPADSQSSAMASQSDFDKFCAECCWHGMDMTCSHPVVSPGHCLDFNCSNGNSNSSSSSSRHDPTALQPRHPHPHPPPSQSGECELDVTCCEAEDCSSSSCTTVCDGFVDCDQSTVCSEDHCDDDECRDVATACYDENCGGDGGDDSLEQMTHDILAQTQNNPLQWNNGPSSYHLGHANGVFPTTPAYGSASEQGDGHGEFSAAENNQSALKPMDFNNYYHVSPHCTSGKLPHVFDSSMCHNQGTLVPGNVLHCTMSDPCCNLDACGQQQCNLDSSSFANCPTESHFGFVVPWNTPHASYPSHHLHQQQLPPRDMKTLEPQSCHHLPHNDTGPARSTPTHTPSLSTGSSPVSPPDARSQSIYSALTTPDLPSSSSAAEESHVCKWIHKKTNGPSTICGVSFPDTTSLQEHLVHAHSDAIGGTLGQGFYCCWEGCHRPGEPFSQKSKLQGHFLTHSNHKNFQCPTCGKSFARQATLERHERSHRGDKPYECSLCRKTFTDSSELKTHLRTHTGEKPFKCSFPGCTFETGDSSNMSSHKLTHGVRKHKCPFPQCSKSFTRPDQLKRHLKSTHKMENVSLDDLSPSSTRAPSVVSC